MIERNPADVSEMDSGAAILVTLMDRYLAGLMDPFISLLEVQKLLYFLQEAGQPLRLNYKQHIYGPYADNLRHVLAKIEGHFVSGFADGGEAPDKQLQLVPGAIDDARAWLAEDHDATARLRRVGDLVEGFETPFGMELLATVHWVAKHGALDDAAVVKAVHGWNDRKRQFSADQIKLALGVLRAKGWVSTGDRGSA